MTVDPRRPDPTTGDALTWKPSTDRMRQIELHYAKQALIKRVIVHVGLMAALSPYEDRAALWNEQSKLEKIESANPAVWEGVEAR